MGNEQKDLFDTEPAPWELDDQSDQTVASIVFSEAVDGSFDYLVPNELISEICPGKRVKVPFGKGNRDVIGYCIAVKNIVASRKLKSIKVIVDKYSLLSSHMLALTKWMSEHYLEPLGKVLEAVLPAGVREQSGTREKVFLTVPTEVAARISSLKLSEMQAAALKFLAASPKAMTVEELAASVHIKTTPIQALRKKGLVREEKRRINIGEPNELPNEAAEPINLNVDQAAAIDSIITTLEAQLHETFLLHGVTGSGKTEVYIRAIEQVIRFGRQAIVLVPEISLTPQTRRRFRARFNDIAVLHSHLSNSERHWYWQQIVSGKVQVVIGARSAIFAPTPHLGLIIIDEEHDGSFKQDSVPRYHARDVARMRAELERIPLVLGSATPSLESWHAAKTGKASLISMPRRVSQLPLPFVDVVDSREELRMRTFKGGIGRQLNLAIHHAISAGGQVILLLNRRGFSTHIQCPACGEVAKCKDCDIALTHHRDGEKVICHYCDFETTATIRCPACDFDGIRYGGLGTQKLEAEVRTQFPRFECLRMDSDTMRKPGSHEAAFSRFRSGEIKILLGTQMIAKGLDFPNVTLVGVINADTGLHMPDFRAAERTFQLVTQVSGRTGRSEKGGRVLVQTFNPDHPSIVAASCHDFLGFAEREMPNRELFGYPPFGAMIRIVVRGENETAVSGFADQIALRIADDFPDDERFRLMGPAPAPISKLRGLFRFHMIVQGPTLEDLRPRAKIAKSSLKTPTDVQWIIDVDPTEML